MYTHKRLWDKLKTTNEEIEELVKKQVEITKRLEQLEYIKQDVKSHLYTMPCENSPSKKHIPMASNKSMCEHCGLDLGVD
jgi:methionyl-tRNA synthetase